MDWYTVHFEDFRDESDYIDLYTESEEMKTRPDDEEIDEPELLEYDNWTSPEVEELASSAEKPRQEMPDPEPAPPDPDEPAETDTPAERSGKLLRREMKAEALRRTEEAARTPREFEKVLAAWDKREANRDRTIRSHEWIWGDTPLKDGVSDLEEPMIFPTWLGRPLERQLAKGYFADFLAYCPYDMHDLSGKEYICEAVDRMKEDHKELLFFLGLQHLSPQRVAELKGQTDRNIRKVRDTMLRKLQKRLYVQLMKWMEYGYHPTHREEAFIARYEAEREGTCDEAV